MNEAWLKQHWYYIAAAFIGLFVLYEILSNASSSSSSSGGTSSTDQLSALNSSASINDAAYNAQTEIAAYQAGVQNNTAVLGAQVSEAQIAAELAATEGQTSAAETVAVAGDKTQQNIELGLGADAVSAQKIVTAGQVQQTQIEGNTIDTLGAQSEAVKKLQINTVASQISNLMAYSKHFGSDIQAIAPVIAEETGQGSSAGSVKKPAGSTTAQNISAVSGGLNSILGTLFG